MEAKRVIGEPQAASKYACTLCARRKVGCDKRLPACGTCVKHKAECIYEDPAPPKRRKRPADFELLDRIAYLEKQLQQHGIDAEPEEASSMSGLPWLPADHTSKGDEPTEREPESYRTRKPAPAVIVPQMPIGAKLPSAYLQDPSVLKLMDKSNKDTPKMSIASFFTAPPTQSLVELHPEPRHIFRLWQVFAERSNPVIKILHAPTVQQRIIDSSWDLQACPAPFQALLFSIYLLATISMSEAECMKHFGEERNRLLKRYQAGARQSLIAADLFHTRELEVLQAFVLFLMSDPKSDTSTTLSAIAVRLALKMGLDRERPQQEMSLFEQEMRIRLWWQICTQDILARHSFVGRDGNNTDGIVTSNTRLPFNVNDAELHPDMVKPPVESPRATEMIYVLLRYEGAQFGQRLRVQGRLPTLQGSPFDELERLMTEKYLRHCDSRIPLQNAAMTMLRFAMTSIRYRVACHKAGAAPTGATADMLLDKAVEVLEVERASRDVPFASQLLWSVSPVDLDAVVHILSYLRQHGSGERAARGWVEVVRFWDEHLEDMTEETASQSTFLTSLADLSIEAWQERKKEITATSGKDVATQMMPECVQKLQQQRDKVDEDVQTDGSSGNEDGAMLSDGGLDTWDLSDLPSNLFDFGNDLLYDFGFWSEFSQP